MYNIFTYKMILLKLKFINIFLNFNFNFTTIYIIKLYFFKYSKYVLILYVKLLEIFYHLFYIISMPDFYMFFRSYINKNIFKYYEDPLLYRNNFFKIST